MSKNYLFLKTFLPDLERVVLLCGSIEKHNKGDLPLVVAVPGKEVDEFRRFLPGWVELIAEEEIACFSINRRLPGWREQQLIKFMFGVSYDVNKYLVLDSDCQFIRDFDSFDLFGSADEIPLVLTEKYYRYSKGNEFSLSASLGKICPKTMDKEKVAFYFDGMFQIDRNLIGNKAVLSKKPIEVGGLINMSFGRKDNNRIFFMPTPIVWSSAIVCDMWSFLREQGLSFSDLLLYSPWEAIWYGHWALSKFRNKIRAIEPISMHFSTDEDIVDARSNGVTRETLSKNFIAVTLAARHQKELAF
ncbi:TPA: hypothetical protein OUC02_004562 [Escherichia coli]|nr:hypothetical protein [Escherichia coli]